MLEELQLVFGDAINYVYGFYLFHHLLDKLHTEDVGVHVLLVALQVAAMLLGSVQQAVLR